MSANGTATGGNAPASEVTTVDNPAQSRFELYENGDMVGVLGYHPDSGGADEDLAPGTVVGFMHTVVVEDRWGHGLAARLVAHGLTVARERGWRVRPVCTYVQRFVATRPEYRDLIVD